MSFPVGTDGGVFFNREHFGAADLSAGDEISEHGFRNLVPKLERCAAYRKGQRNVFKRGVLRHEIIALEYKAYIIPSKAYAMR